MVSLYRQQSSRLELLLKKRAQRLLLTLLPTPWMCGFAREVSFSCRGLFWQRKLVGMMWKKSSDKNDSDSRRSVKKSCMGSPKDRLK